MVVFEMTNCICGYHYCHEHMELQVLRIGKAPGAGLEADDDFAWTITLDGC